MIKKILPVILPLVLTGCYDSELVFEDQYRIVVARPIFMQVRIRLVSA